MMPDVYMVPLPSDSLTLVPTTLFGLRVVTSDCEPYIPAPRPKLSASDKRFVQEAFKRMTRPKALRK
jgi:hypothetical protein